MFRNKNVICLISGGNVDIASLAAVIGRGLFAQNRRARFRFEVADRPGALADITTALADANANILELTHRRHTRGIALNMAEVDVEVETHDAQDAARIEQELARHKRFEVTQL